jgi:hypothetical protein
MFNSRIAERAFAASDVNFLPVEVSKLNKSVKNDIADL